MEILHCLETDREGRGIFAQFCSYFSACLKETPIHYLTQKELACQISVDSEQLEKSQQNQYIRLSSTEPFNYWSRFQTTYTAAMSSEEEATAANVLSQMSQMQQVACETIEATVINVGHHCDVETSGAQGGKCSWKRNPEGTYVCITLSLLTLSPLSSKSTFS